ncbi:MAG TPA: cation diffusion facilitator family transporter [Nitrososphaeraceae archaeon]|nr:cation diffusion facilitator family transporter [Nitrososphaeraceae archaeon]
MDESSDLTKETTNDNNSKSSTNGSKYSYDMINEGIVVGQNIAKISVITLVSLGVIELLIGYVSGSVVVVADGTDSLSDAMISFIVLIGLRIAHKPADRKFHFGYHKVESLAALIAAMGMVIMGSIIIYNSYQSLLHPHEIKHSFLTMIVLAAASGISLHRAFQMRKIANRYDILSLKTDAKNSIKDGLGSIIAFFSVLISSQFGFLQADAIGGIIIAGYIFSVAYVSIKRTSLILVDSWQDPQVTDLIRKTIEQKFGGSKEPIKVRSVLLRPKGVGAIGAIIHMEVDGSKSLTDVELLSLEIEMEIRSKISSIERISVVPHPFRPLSAKDATSSSSSRLSKIFTNNRKNKLPSL